MVVTEVEKLPAIERFLYWIRERHNIHVKRNVMMRPKPWTDDSVLQTNFFTNPYRENDKVTQWFKEHIREPLRDDPAVLFATVLFRWFNLPRTATALSLYRPSGDQYDLGLFEDWNEQEAVRILQELWQDGPVFTGAYMIKAGNGEAGCKIPNVCRAVTEVWKQREQLVEVCYNDCRLQALWSRLKELPFLGKFMSYEIVCDLRYTALLERATDIDTWANPGPGALRGLLRLEGGVPGLNGRGKSKRSVSVQNPLQKMVDLLVIVRQRLPRMPHFELREVEHSLCEWDKYERARLGDGKMKRKFEGRK